MGRYMEPPVRRRWSICTHLLTQPSRNPRVLLVRTNYRSSHGLYPTMSARSDATHQPNEFGHRVSIGSVVGIPIPRGVLAYPLMNELTARALGDPDGTATFENGRLETTTVGEVTFMGGTVEPGWPWSRDYGPAMGSERSPLSHNVYMIAGQLTVEMDDGTQPTLSQGDISITRLDTMPGWRETNKPSSSTFE